MNASGLPEFRPVYDLLSRMAFYNLNPARMREPQSPTRGERLAPDGANVASVELTSESTTFINDEVVTRQAVYFTDSFRPVYYRLPLMPNGTLPDSIVIGPSTVNL